MKKQFSIYTSIFILSLLSVASICFLNSVGEEHPAFERQATASRESASNDNVPADSTNQAQTNKLKRAKQENYLPNLTILNYVIQKGIESLPVLRLKDFIPILKGKQN